MIKIKEIVKYVKNDKSIVIYLSEKKICIT